MPFSFSPAGDFPRLKGALATLYGVEEAGAQFNRYKALVDKLEETFGAQDAIALFSAPGRVEIGGNHTDHQHGKVLAGSVNLDVIAAVAPRTDSVICVQSEGFPLDRVSLDDLSVHEEEKNTSAALLRGIAAQFVRQGCPVRGFSAYTVSNVPKGSGLSSSAAFESLLAGIFNSLFNRDSYTPVELARIGQHAENVYFGKPSGLLDQTASSVGGLVAVDFREGDKPDVEKIPFDFASSGHALCILDCGANHADLTGEYAAVTEELKKICACFGKSFLREVSEPEFYAVLPRLRETCGDRAVLRAVHVFQENRRVEQETAALRSGDFPGFLAQVRESGLSSWRFLQNVTPPGAVVHQEAALALALCEAWLEGRGASRIHGGGFGGTVQAFVPLDKLETFRRECSRVLGEGACHILSIRPVGVSRLA